MKIAVLGGFGQLGTSLQRDNSVIQSEDQWEFFSSSQVDITSEEDLTRLLKRESGYDYVVNCAAYTAVDQAESEPEKAFHLNAEGPKLLAQLCKATATTLIHISTDFVFGGQENTPLKETDLSDPLSVYGKSKFAGEKFVQNELPEHFILRTGWVYSIHKKNFLKSMLKLFGEKPSLGIVYDQVGTPTHTSVICTLISRIIHSRSTAYGLYHIANEGVCSWYDFAREIAGYVYADCKINPILSAAYPTPAQRPAYSVLDKAKVKSTFDLKIPHWKTSLQDCLKIKK